MLATPLLYDIALVTSLSLRISKSCLVGVVCEWEQKQIKTKQKKKKGSTLKYFYWLAVITVTKSALT